MAELSLVQLRHFCAVAELRSIAEVARQRHVAATAVSAAISSLEKILGTALCQRERSRGVVLTAAGHHFYREAQQVIRSADDLLRNNLEAPHLYTGPLIMGAFRPIAPAIFPALLEHFHERHPDVSVEFTTGTMLDLVEQLLAGDIHCFFGYDTFQRLDTVPQGLARELLYNTELFALVARDHPIAELPHVAIDDLLDEPMVLFESNPSQRFSAPALGRLHPGAKVRYRTSDYELMRSLVARKLGYSLIMDPFHLGASFEGKELAKVPLRPSLAGSAVVAVRPEGRWQHPASRALIDLAHELAERGELGAGG